MLTKLASHKIATAVTCVVLLAVFHPSAGRLALIVFASAVGLASHALSQHTDVLLTGKLRRVSRWSFGAALAITVLS